MERACGIKLSYEEEGEIKSLISFITLDKEKAEKYIEKYNILLEKLRIHYFINRTKSEEFMNKLNRYLTLFEATIIEFELR